jgi:hypothetical protein
MLLLPSAELFAQNASVNVNQAQKPDVKVRQAQKQKVRNQDALSLYMDVYLPYISVKRNESLYLTLALVENTSNARKRGKALPPIIIHGSNTKRMYDRTLALHGEKIAKAGAYKVLKTDKDLIQFVPVRIRLPYQPWMQNCQLVLVSEVKNYKKESISKTQEVKSKRLTIR